MHIGKFKYFAAVGFIVGLACGVHAQSASATPGTRPAADCGSIDSPSAPAPLPSPAITGPLQAAPPITFEGGPFGKLSLDGIVSGMGLWQGNHVPGDNTDTGSSE